MYRSCTRWIVHSINHCSSRRLLYRSHFNHTRVAATGLSSALFTTTRHHSSILFRIEQSVGRASIMEDFQPPPLRSVHTIEPVMGSLASVRKSRAIFLAKTLEEKAEDAKWYRQDVIDLTEVPTWPEYAEGLDSPVAKKPTSAPKPDLNSKVSVWKGDITKLDVDAIVNAANRSLLGGGGVDGAIHRAAGSHLVQECRTVAPCDTGEAKLTAGYLLPARYVLHTVGPIVNGPTASANHRESLTSCYVTCLQRILEHNKSNRAKLEARKKKEAKDKSSGGGEDAGRGDSSANGKPAVEEDRGGSDILRLLRHDLEVMEPLIRSVAFPCISTGVYGYPQEDACQVALSVIREWLEDNPNELDRVVFCVFLERDLKIYERLLPSFFPLEGMSLASRNEDDDET